MCTFFYDLDAFLFIYLVNYNIHNTATMYMYEYCYFFVSFFGITCYVSIGILYEKEYNTLNEARLCCTYIQNNSQTYISFHVTVVLKIQLLILRSSIY